MKTPVVFIIFRFPVAAKRFGDPLPQETPIKSRGRLHLEDISILGSSQVRAQWNIHRLGVDIDEDIIAKFPQRETNSDLFLDDWHRRDLR